LPTGHRNIFLENNGYKGSIDNWQLNISNKIGKAHHTKCIVIEIVAQMLLSFHDYPPDKNYQYFCHDFNKHTSCKIPCNLYSHNYIVNCQ
jgi:hypothetical protein